MSEVLTLTVRGLRLSRRQVDGLITSLLLPVLMMIMFVELFGGAIDTGGRYVTYVVPGVVLLCAGFGSGLTAVAVSQDMAGGLVDRLRSMDVRGASLLAGHVVASVARNAASELLVLAVALLLGFDPRAGVLDWCAAAGIVLAFVLAVSWLAAAIGMLARSAEAANAITFVFVFLPYASSAFVPVRTMPGWMHGFAAHQPFTPLAEALRGLLLGTPTGAPPWIALGWCGGTLAVSVALAGVPFARRTA
jgi:ABC-2 type transport system permease protein